MKMTEQTQDATRERPGAGTSLPGSPLGGTAEPLGLTEITPAGRYASRLNPPDNRQKGDQRRHSAVILFDVTGGFRGY